MTCSFLNVCYMDLEGVMWCIKSGVRVCVTPAFLCRSRLRKVGQAYQRANVWNRSYRHPRYMKSVGFVSLTATSSTFNSKHIGWVMKNSGPHCLYMHFYRKQISLREIKKRWFTVRIIRLVFSKLDPSTPITSILRLVILDKIN